MLYCTYYKEPLCNNRICSGFFSVPQPYSLSPKNFISGLSLPLVRTSSRASRAWILPSWGDYATQLESLEHRELGDHNTLLGRVTPAKPGILSISCAGAGDSWPTSSPSAGSRLVGRPDEANRAWSASAALVSAHQATPLEHCEHQPLAFLTTTPCCHHEHQPLTRVG